MRMTFYIPPVFLFANKVKHNNKPINRPKTATQTEIEIDNRNIKRIAELEEENKKLNKQIEQFKKGVKAGTNIIERLEEENKKLKERIDILYEFIEINDKLVDEVIDEEDLDKLNRYIYIDDDLVDRALESEE